MCDYIGRQTDKWIGGWIGRPIDKWIDKWIGGRINQYEYANYARQFIFALWFVLLVFLLGGCGFTPLYVEKGSISHITTPSKITIEEPGGRIAQIVRNRLIEKINPSGEAYYKLSFNASPSIANLAIERDSRVTRVNYRLTVKYRLVDIETENLIAKGSTVASASYNKVASEFANKAAEQNAGKRTAQTVADQLVLQLTVALTEIEPPAETLEGQTE